MKLTTCVRAEKGGHRVGMSHLLQNRDEESDLHLSRLLQKAVKSGCALSFGKDTEPLLDGTQFILEISIERGSSHLFQSCFVIL